MNNQTVEKNEKLAKARVKQDLKEIEKRANEDAKKIIAEFRKDDSKKSD